jgi:hypothetical protein
MPSAHAGHTTLGQHAAYDRHKRTRLTRKTLCDQGDEAALGIGTKIGKKSA